MDDLQREPISVVIPTYNRAHMISDAVRSAMEQCRGEDEILVIDDGSSDTTPEIMSRLGEPVRYIQQENAGAGAARNHGIREATHDLVAFLDSDDLWAPEKLNLQVPLMTARSDLVMSFGDFSVRHTDGRISEWYLQNWHRDERDWEEILGPGRPLSELTALLTVEHNPAVHIGSLYHAQMAGSYVFTSTVMARRSAAVRGLYFTEGLSMYEDWACYGRLAGAGPVAFINEQLAIQRGHAEGRLTDADAHARARARVRVLEEVWGSDSEYLNKWSRYYVQVLREQKIIVTASLISEGRNRDARALLREIDAPPLTYQLLASLPSGAARTLLSLRRQLLRMLGR